MKIPTEVSVKSGAHCFESSGITSARKDRWSRAKWSDCRFSFEGAEIDRGDLSKIHLDAAGNMTFHGARFIGGFHFSKVHLNGAPVWFSKATFGGEYVTFNEGDFRGSMVTFDEVDFAGAKVTFEKLELSPNLVTFHEAKHTAGEVNWGPLDPLPRTTPRGDKRDWLSRIAGHTIRRSN